MSREKVDAETWRVVDVDLLEKILNSIHPP